MCGRYQVLPRDQVRAIAASASGQMALDALADISAADVRDVYPNDTILAIDSTFNVVELVWGFDVEWSRNPVFNTRIESLLDGSEMWQNANEHGRCVIPAARFYEPHMNEKVRSQSTGRAVKRPYIFALGDNEALLFAGVSENGRCSIVTTQPNQSVASIHDRMPLILRPDEVRRWFAGELSSLADRSEISLDVGPADTRLPIVESEQLGLF